MNEFGPASAENEEMRRMMEMNTGHRMPENMDPSIRHVMGSTRTQVGQDMDWPTMPQ